MQLSETTKLKELQQINQTVLRFCVVLLENRKSKQKTRFK